MNKHMLIFLFIFTDEETMKTWWKYVEETISCYKGVVKEWEI